MKKLILTSLCILMGMTSVSAQNAAVKVATVKAASDKESLKKEILEVSQRTNNYFMTKYSDPTARRELPKAGSITGVKS